MTKGEIFGYPLMMIASIILLASVAVSAYHDAPSMTLSFNDQILALIVFVLGFLLAALANVFRLRVSSGSKRGKVSPSSINPPMIHAIVSIATSEEEKREPLPPWELTSASLVGRDNALALAKLRLDLERTLREVAYEHNVDLAKVPAGVVKLAEVLATRGVLEHELIEPLRQITHVCNQAIHGYDIADDLADAVVAAGDEVLVRLQAILGAASSR